MPRRAVRLGVLAAAAALSLSACGWASPVRTQQVYAPSDGVRVEVADGVRVENLMVVTGGNFDDGWVLGAVANDMTEPVTVQVEVGGTPEEVRVQPGAAEALSFAVGGLQEQAGTLTTATITFAGTTTMQIPVLDGETSPYAEAEPSR